MEEEVFGGISLSKSSSDAVIAGMIVQGYFYRGFHALSANGRMIQDFRESDLVTKQSYYHSTVTSNTRPFFDFTR